MTEKQTKKQNSDNNLKLNLSSFQSIFLCDSNWKQRINKNKTFLRKDKRNEAGDKSRQLAVAAPFFSKDTEVQKLNIELAAIRGNLLELKKIIKEKERSFSTGARNLDLSKQYHIDVNQTDKMEPSISKETQQPAENQDSALIMRDKPNSNLSHQCEKTIEYILDNSSKEVGVFQEDDPSADQ